MRLIIFLKAIFYLAISHFRKEGSLKMAKTMMALLLLFSTALTIEVAGGKFLQCGETLNPPVPRPPSRSASSRVISGREVIKSEFPFIMSIQKRKKSDTTAAFEHFCMGMILNTRYILTAGNCLDGRSAKPANDAGQEEYRVVIGTLKISEVNNRLEVDQFLLIDNYDADKTNLGLIKTKNTIRADLRKDINCIELPKPSNEDIRNLLVMGWGVQSRTANPPRYPDILQAILVTILPGRNCIDAGIAPAFNQAEQICTTAAACTGNDGMPGVIARDGKYVVVGILSKYRCDATVPRNPEVFMQVLPFLD